MDILTQIAAANTKEIKREPRINRRVAELYNNMTVGEEWFSQKVVESFGWNKNCVSAMMLDLARRGLIHRVGIRSEGKARIVIYVREK